MADQTYSSSDKKISISGGKKPLNPKEVLAGMSDQAKKRWVKVCVVAGVGLVFASMWMATPSGPAKRAAVDQTVMIDTTPRGLSSQKDWKSQAGAEITELRQSLRESQAAQKELLARMEALRQEVTQVKAGTSGPQNAGPAKVDLTIPPPPEPPKSIVQPPARPADIPVAAGQPASPGGSTPAAPAGGSSGVATIEKPRTPARSFIPAAAVEEAKQLEEKAKVQEEMVPNDKMGFLPAASFAGATLISGVEALTGQTAQSHPQPLVIRIDEHAVLPNAAKYQLKGCHVLASVWGEMSSERVYGRVATLTCVDKDNKLVLSEEVEGSLMDSDGKHGVRGMLQDRQGAKLGRSLLAGFAQGMSNMLGMAQGTTATNALSGTTTSISGGAAVAASLYNGANNAAQSLAQYYMKQAEATLPIIAVDAGRKVSILFTQSKSLKFETTGNYKMRPKPSIKVEREVR